MELNNITICNLLQICVAREQLLAMLGLLGFFYNLLHCIKEPSQ